MTMLVLGLLLFLGIHSVSIISVSFRDSMAAKSALGWKAFYSIVSLLGVILIAKGYAAARLDPVIIYNAPLWLRHLAFLLMLPAMIFFVAPYFPGRISQTLKHPQLVAVKIWALSHLLVNGTLADIVLFGAFLAWAVVDRISMKKRSQRPLPGLKLAGINDVIAIVIGLGATVALLFSLHGMLIGMPLLG